MNSIKPEIARIALVGCGPISNFHVDAVNGVGMRVTDVAASKNSVTVGSFASKFDIPNVWKDPEQLILEGSWDGLVLAAPTKAMLPLLTLAISRNLPVLVEKPVAMSSFALDSIQGNPQQVMVAYNRRFYPKIQELKQILQISKPALISVEIPEKLLPSSTGALNEIYSGVIQNSAHMFDIIRFLAGALEIVFVDSPGDRKRELGSLMVLRSEHGHLISLKMNYQASANFSITADIDTKRYSLLPLELLSIYDGMNVVEPTQEVPVRSYKPQLQSQLRSDPSEFKYKPGFLGQAQAFKELMLGEPSSYMAHLDDTRKALQIAEILINPLNQLPFPIKIN
ncbi:unannotated protein [freshwater metagenome]|uniref:Unannotated protein n=1 Tax=freshwater metagenome TaxID=449393 RepID=A0A6J7W8Y7_9ZZZZ